MKQRKLPMTYRQAGVDVGLAGRFIRTVEPMAVDSAEYNVALF